MFITCPEAANGDKFSNYAVYGDLVYNHPS